MSTPSSIVLYPILHGTVYILAMTLILAALERGATLRRSFAMAAAMVAPWLLLGLLPIVFSSSFNYMTYIMLKPVALILAFPVLLFFLKIGAKRSALYTFALIVVSNFSPIVIRAGMRLFDGEPGAAVFLAATIGVLVIFWRTTTKMENERKRTNVRCYGLAALIAPTLVVGHGGGIILPAGMVWPIVFSGSAEGLVALLSLFISVTVSGALLSLIYKFLKERSNPAVEVDNQ